MTLVGSRSKKSLLNAITAMAMTLVNGLLGIVVTRFVLARFGSDFNGLNSTANQIVNVLLILEGGFTMASNVALFAPLTQGDYPTVNGVLGATRRKFGRIGAIFLGAGAVIAVVYGLVANSGLSFEFVTTLILMTVVPAAFNLFYATTYRVLLQTEQKEYVINIITTLTIGGGHIANIVMVYMGGPMWAVRFNTMVFALFNSLLIAWYVKRRAPFLNFSVPQRPELIKGTGDVMAQRITGVIYNSAPIVFLSISPTGGTALASVYAVYNNVFIMVKSLLHSFIDAPRLSFGQMLTERKRDEVWPVYAQYEYLAFFATFLLVTTCGALILPFISLYTGDLADAVNYYDLWIALFMIAIAALEMIHIPSGHLINMAGHFRVSRNIQVSSCAVLVVTMSVGGILWGIYGMLAAILLCAVLLCVTEMGYVHVKFFEGKLLSLFRLLAPFILTGTVLCYFEMKLPLHFDNYLWFIVYGVGFAAVNGVAGLLVGLLFNRKELLPLIGRAVRLLKRK